MPSTLAATRLAANTSRFTFAAGDTHFEVVKFKATETISEMFELSLDLASE